MYYFSYVAPAVEKRHEILEKEYIYSQACRAKGTTNRQATEETDGAVFLMTHAGRRRRKRNALLPSSFHSLPSPMSVYTSLVCCIYSCCCRLLERREYDAVGRDP